MLVEQRFCGDEEPRRAVAALRSAKVRESVLQRMETAVGHQTFDGQHLTPVAFDAEDEAGEDRLTVEQHSAGAAFPQLAAVLRAAEIQILTEHL